MSKNVFAVATGRTFGFIPSNELEGINLVQAGAVRYEEENWNLFKATTHADSRKVDLLLDKYSKLSIGDYKIEPVIMSGEIELLIPGFNKDRDSFMFGGYLFVCGDKEIPVDFSGTSWNIEQDGDMISVPFITGRTPLATDCYLDDCYADDYLSVGLRINDITAEFLSNASSISEFMVSLEMNGTEYSPEDIAKIGRFTIKSLCFENNSMIYPVKQDVIDAFNEKLEKNNIKSLSAQIQSASTRASKSCLDSHAKAKEPERDI